MQNELASVNYKFGKCQNFSLYNVKFIRVIPVSETI